jgi:hypothetical protein
VTGPPAERYLRLGLRLGTHVDGIVDAYFGPPELAAAVKEEPPVDPQSLATDADSLLEQLGDGWLRDQVVGLRTFAGVLAGKQVSYAEEVEGCYGVRPSWTDEGVFAAAHAELEELLPGSGPLSERHERWREDQLIPDDQVEPLIREVMSDAQSWTRDLVDMPDGEAVAIEFVRDEPWLAFNYYLGGLQSRMAVNLDLPKTALDLVRLTIHETYPGHHAERCLKDQLLVSDRGLLEEAIVLVPTPQSLVSEGIAELAPTLVLEAGFGLDLDEALAVERASEPLRWSEVNAALLLHDHGAGEAEVQTYLERWGLMSSELAAHMIRFLTERTSRSYVLTYSAGRDLCRSYVDGDRDRFRRLLTEQVRVRDLLPRLPAPPSL